MRYPIPPIVGVQVYKRDAVIVRRKGQTPRDKPTRGIVTQFTLESRQRLAFVAANTDVVFRTMLTLTYPETFPSNGVQVKQHLRAFLMWLKRDLACSFEYLWFLEFQRRGAPHYHILIDFPLPIVRRKKTRMMDGKRITVTENNLQAKSWIKHFRFRVAAAWYRIANTGDPKHLAAGTRVEAVRKPDGAARYAVKYALKMYQKDVPPGYRDVGRFWGHSRAVKPQMRQEHRVTEDDVRGTLEGWRYAPSLDRPVYKVLYGRAQAFER